MAIKFINRSKNTIFLSDIEKHIPFIEEKEQEQEISLEDAKKSSDFRKFVSLGQFFIICCGNSIFEKNLLLRQSQISAFIPEKGENMSLNFLENNKEQDPEKIEVKLRGHFYEHGGYAKVNRNLAIGLDKLGVKIQVDSVNNTKSQLSEEETRQISKLRNPVSKNAIVIESIIPTFSCMAGGKYKILYTTIEAETIPKQFLDISNSYNEVWVNSDFAKNVLEKSGFRRPIFIFPNIIDDNHYIENCEPYEFNPPLKNFVFISVFGWSYRKGYDALLKAYLSAFSGKDDVSLLIVSRNHLGMSKDDVIKNTIQKYISEYGGDNPAHIARYSKAIPEKNMPSIYRACNAFVLFTRGESFCVFPNARIKTPDGIKAIKDIKIGDKVFSHTGDEDIVKNTFERDYSGEMIKIKCFGRNNQSITLTPSHMVRAIKTSETTTTTATKLFRNIKNYDKQTDQFILEKDNGHFNNIHTKYNLEWIKSEDLKPGDYIFYPRINYISDVPEFLTFEEMDTEKRYHYEKDAIHFKSKNQFCFFTNLSSVLFPKIKVKVDKNLMKLFGYYMAEGCCGDDGTIIFAFHEKEKEYHKEVADLMMEIFGLKEGKPVIVEGQKSYSLRFHSCVVTMFFRKILGRRAREKKMPTWFFNMDDELKISFLNGLFNGDGYYGRDIHGSKNDVNKVSFTTASEDLANNVFDMLQHFEIKTSIKSRIIKEKLYYNVSVSNIADHNKLMALFDIQKNDMTSRFNYNCFITKKDYQVLEIRKIEKINYTGKVHNIETEKNNSYICENLAVHNCTPFCEASLCGLPVIATNCSGQTMYLKNNNSFLVDIDGSAPMASGQMQVHYWDGETFPLLTSPKFIYSAAEKMRFVYENINEAKNKNKALKSFVADNYNMVKVTTNIKARLQAIWDNMKKS